MKQNSLDNSMSLNAFR